MLLTDIPYKFAQIFANAATAGYVTTPIPATATGGNISQHLGFPPITSFNPAAGGLPPTIEDFNGVFQYFSAWVQWIQAGGGTVTYDATFQTAIGGYPNHAIVASATTANVAWRSTADNNVTNPDSAGAGWASILAPQAINAVNITGGTITGLSLFTMPGGSNNIRLGPMTVLNSSGTFMSVENDQGGAAAQFCANTAAFTSSIKSQVQSGNCALMGFFFGATAVGSITTDTVHTIYGTSSDYRIKKNINPLTGATEILRKMKPSSFSFVHDDKDTTFSGFIAHELQEVYPQAVHFDKDQVDKDGKPVLQQVDFSKIVPVLVSALQDALAKADLMEQRLAKLEGKKP